MAFVEVPDIIRVQLGTKMRLFKVEIVCFHPSAIGTSLLFNELTAKNLAYSFSSGAAKLLSNALKEKSMQAYERIRTEWNKSMATLVALPHMQLLATQKISLKQYMAFLRETYFHAGLNPQIQAAATIYFKDNPRDVIKRFYQHAISEISHDLLALNDLATLGVDVSDIPKQRPLPSTTALNAFPLFEMQFRNPMAYLGYLFHLEFMPTQNGKEYMSVLENIGVPKSAMTFIEEHATVDMQHNKFMEFYINKLIQTEADLEAAIYGVVATCELHGKMISSAFEAVDRGAIVFSQAVQKPA